jgi:tRNA-dihydrouridine synthase A
MLGREAYHHPYLMADFDARYYQDNAPIKSRREVLEDMIPYLRSQLNQHNGHGIKLNNITRHMLGLMTGMAGARLFRQRLSDSKKLALGQPELLLEALALIQDR